MNAETLKALRGSIEKWRKIAYHGGRDLKSRNCPLCRLFASMDAPTCRGCPVRDAVGMSGCVGTPYMEWHRYADAGESSIRVFNTESKRLAIAELKFLRSLLPKNRK